MHYFDVEFVASNIRKPTSKATSSGKHEILNNLFAVWLSAEEHFWFEQYLRIKSVGPNHICMILWKILNSITVKTRY